MVEETKKPRSTGRRLLKALWVALFAIVIGLLGLVLGMNVTYAGTMLPNTTVAGVPVGGLTKEAAFSQVEHTMTGRQEITIKIADERLTAEAIDIGISYDVTGAVNHAYLRGKSGSIWQQMYALASSVVQQQEYAISPVIDQASLSAYINDQIANKIKTPKDASLAVVGDKITVKPDVPGTAINLEQIKADIQRVVSTGGPIVVEAQVKKVDAAVTAAGLARYQNQIQQLAGAPVTITAQDKTLTPTFAQKVTWFVLDKNKQGEFNLEVDAKAITTTVAQLAKTVDKKMVKEQISPTNSVIAAGSDGLELDQTNLATALTDKMRQSLADNATAAVNATAAPVQLAAAVRVVPKEQITVTPEASGVVPGIDTDAKFIQLNLAQQKMYLFENRQLVNVFPISSGKAGYETPKGVHSITNKALRPFSKIYGLYLPYWNAITGDGKYGIHDLPEWPGGYKEGENHLGRPVSHGCVRLGTGPAKYVYEWAPIGTAVLVQ